MPPKKGNKAVKKAGANVGKKRGGQGSTTGPQTKKQRTASANTQLRKAIAEVKSEATTQSKFTPDKKLDEIYGCNKNQITSDDVMQLDITTDLNANYGMLYKSLGASLVLLTPGYRQGGQSQRHQYNEPVWRPNILRKTYPSNGVRNVSVQSQMAISSRELLSSLFEATPKIESIHSYFRPIGNRKISDHPSYDRPSNDGFTSSRYCSRNSSIYPSTKTSLGNSPKRNSIEGISVFANIDNSVSKLTKLVDGFKEDCKNLDQIPASLVYSTCYRMREEIYAVRSEILDLKGVQKHTRSRGPVKDYPLVQNYALEYQRIPKV